MNESHSTSLSRIDINQHQQVSRLYSIQPIGCGLPHVESLTSYVSRLATAHCVPTGLLVVKEIAPLIKPEYSFAGVSYTDCFDKIFKNETAALNGYGNWAYGAVSAVEKLTCRTDISQLTLLNWRKIISNKKLLKRKRAWCPLCFRESLDDSQILYEPLNWSLELLKICPTHKTPLSTTCPYCEKENKPFSWYIKPGFCAKCGGWLGIDSYTYKLPNPKFEAVEDEEQLHYIKYVSDLFCMSLDSFSDKAKISITSHLDHFVEGISSNKFSYLSQVLGASESHVRSLYKGYNTLNLASLLNIRYKLKIDFTTLFEPVCDDVIGKIYDLNKNHKESNKKLISCKPIKGITENQKLVIGKFIRETLERALTEYPPRSLEKVSSEAGMKPRKFRSYERILCKQVSNNYARFRTQKKDEKIKILLEEMKQISQSLYNKGIRPTPSRIAPHMSRPVLILHREARKELEQFLQDNECFEGLS